MILQAVPRISYVIVVPGVKKLALLITAAFKVVEPASMPMNRMIVVDQLAFGDYLLIVAEP